MGEAQPVPRECLGEIEVLQFNDEDPNLPAMVRRRMSESADACLCMVPDGEAYRTIARGQYHAEVLALACGLIELGVAHGDHVALSSENRYEWRVSDVAILAAGGVSVPLHATMTGEQARYQIVDARCRTLIISNQEQADKMAPVIDALDQVERVIAFEPVDWPGKQEVLSYQDLVERGMRASGRLVDEQRRRERALTREDLATIIYTSGTTGVPKGVMLTHDNILFVCDRSRATLGIREGDTLLSWLPLSHSYGRMADHFGAMMGDGRIALAESHEVLLQRITQVQPQFITVVPRVLEKIFAATSLLPPAEQRARLKELFGRRLEWLISGGAPLPATIAHVYLDAGIILVEGYGLTETSAITTYNLPSRYRTGTVGMPMPEVQIKIADDGEILIRGRHIMKGYWQMPEDTANTIVDGWLLTGDIGHLDDEGFLVITDRKKDLIVNSAGKNIAPQMIEAELCRVPLIDQALVIGDGRKFLSALIVPEWRAVEKLFSQMGLEQKSPAEAVNNPAFAGVMQSYIDDALKDLAPWERVRKFVLLTEPFSIENDTLTPSLKIRRRQAVECYANQIDALYEE